MKHTRLLFLIGLVIGVGLVAGVDLSGSDGVNVSGGVPLASPNGPTVTVYGQTNMSLSDAFSSNAVNITSEAGNVTFSSPGATSVDVHSSNLTGTWTNVTAVTAPVDLTISPEDKQQVITNGSVSDLSIRDMAVDDGTTDFWINGTGTANLTVYDLPADTTIQAVEAGTVLDNTTTDASGVGTFTLNLSSHTVSLQTASTTTTGDPTANLPVRIWLYVGSVGIGMTIITMLTQTTFVRRLGNADGVAIISGVAGFVSWGLFAYGSFGVGVPVASQNYVFTMPAVALLGVLMAIFCGYVALTGPIEIINRYRTPRQDEL